MANFEIRVEKISNKNKIFRVFETRTEQFLSQFTDYKQAQKLVKSLNTGMGFGGFTPAFMMNKIHA